MKNMTRYVALLRGINVSGKNKVSMPALKEGFEQLAFEDVKTYLNSGNVIFSSHEDDIKKLTNQIELMIHNQFHLDISVFVISKQDLLDILHNSPQWWGNNNKDIYDNLIFIIPPAKFLDVYNEIGEPKKELEKIENYKEVIFWSFSRKDYQKNKLVVQDSKCKYQCKTNDKNSKYSQKNSQYVITFQIME